jgi:hypothetical protein
MYASELQVGLAPSATRRKERAGFKGKLPLDPLAATADLLDRLFHRRRRSAGLLRCILDFVILTAGDARGVVCARGWSLSLPLPYRNAG